MKGSWIVSCQVSELKLLMEETNNCQSWQRDLLLMAVSHLVGSDALQAPAALALAGLSMSSLRLAVSAPYTASRHPWPCPEVASFVKGLINTRQLGER